jgi:DNA end-binding protein Ku
MAGPRSIWNGTIAFGLVTVPIKVYSATESKSVHFHQVHLADGARIEHRRVCPEDGEEVPADELVKGYEVREGEFVELTKDEVSAAAGERSKLVDVEHFVPGEAIDPAFYDTTYYLGVGDGGEDAYRLLRAALVKSGKVAIARWVFHDRERLVAVRPLGDHLLGLHTMHFHDEIVEVDELELAEPAKAPSEREVQMAGKLVDSLAAKFEPADYADGYRAAVLAVIERKAKGETVGKPAPPAREESDDLAAALEASLA